MKRFCWTQCIKFALFIAMAIFLFAYVVMLLWNWLVPDLFDGPEVGYWQAMGIMVLSKILFGGLKHGWSHKHGGHGGDKHSHWRQKWHQKMEGMSPEERDRYKEQIRQKCGWTFDDDQSAPHNDKEE